MWSTESLGVMAGLGCLFKFQIPGPIQVERPRMPGPSRLQLLASSQGDAPAWGPVLLRVRFIVKQFLGSFPSPAVSDTGGGTRQSGVRSAAD